MDQKTSSKSPSRKTIQAVTKPLPKPTTKSQATPKKKVTQDQIAMRAYFISEERKRNGYDGDHLSDWIEAERQLSVER